MGRRAEMQSCQNLHPPGSDPQVGGIAHSWRIPFPTWGERGLTFSLGSPDPGLLHQEDDSPYNT